MYMGKPLKKVYPHASKWEVFKYKVRKFFISLFTWIALIAILVGIYKIGGILNPSTIVTTAQVIQQVEVKAPVMERIAKCESPTGHYKNGQVVLLGNKNGSVDIGKYQINNKIWGVKAQELGYNLFIEKDNEAMAFWIYKNYGTDPWIFSKSCWR